MRWVFARFLSTVVLGLLLGLCAGWDSPIVAAAAESSGDWQITAKVDDIAKTKIFNVKLEARKTAHSGLFLPPDAILQLVCLKNQPLIHVMFAFQIGSKADSEILYHFDDKPMQPVEARILRGLKIFVIEEKAEVNQFLDGLAKANALYIAIGSLDRGSTSAEFRVAGAQRGIDLLTTYCKPESKKK
jgi:predicted membrane protein